MAGKGHKQEASPCPPLKQGTTFQLLSIPAPTNSSTLSLNLFPASLHREGSLSFENCYLKCNKMQILVKTPSIVPNPPDHKDIDSISSVLDVGL